MSKEMANNILFFMYRANLSGAEAEQYMTCVNWLKEVLKPVEEQFENVTAGGTGGQSS